MSLLSLNCNRCQTVIRMPLGAVLATRLENEESVGRIAYLCDACGDLIDESVSAATLANLEAAGCTVGTVSTCA
jgi:hypothetical protein